jgi:predicted transcriptional regulator
MNRSIVLALHDRGLTGKDLAAVLKVSEQRVSQLLASARGQASRRSVEHHAATA